MAVAWYTRLYQEHKSQKGRENIKWNQEHKSQKGRAGGKTIGWRQSANLAADGAGCQQEPDAAAMPKLAIAYAVKRQIKTKL